MRFMSSVRLFPSFTPLTLDMYKDYMAYMGQFESFSDFNFVSLWSYMGHKCLISKLNGNLVFRMVDYKTHEPFLAMLGENDISNTLAHLFEYLGTTQLPREIRLVPAHMVQDALQKHQQYHFVLDRDNFDYIIDVAKFIKLSGNTFKSKRGDIKKFLLQNKEYESRLLKIHSAQDREHIMSLVNHWTSNGVKSPGHDDVHAIHKLLSHAHDFKTIDYGIFIQGKLRAFTINELIHKDTYMGHFGKADKTFPGIYSFLEYETARYMYENFGCKYLNLQQDLGLSNLRKSKLSYKPCKFLEKGTIAQKATIINHTKI